MPNLQYDFITNTPYYEGQIISCFPSGQKNMVNRSGGIAQHGIAVIHHATIANGYDIATAGSGLLAGIIGANTYYEAFQDGRIGYPDQESTPILVSGIISVYSEVAITSVDNPVYYRFAANGAGKDVLGRFRTDADTATCQLVSAGLKWRDVSNGAGLVPLEVNLLGLV